MFEAISGAASGLRKSTASPLALGWRNETLMLGEIELSCGKFDLSYADASLTSVYGRDVARSAIPYIERAVAAKREGALALSLTHLALAGLPSLPDPEAARERARAAQSLMKRGVSAATIIAALDDKPAVTRDYNPNEARNPKGNGPPSGRWTKDESNADASTPAPKDQAPRIQIADSGFDWAHFLQQLQPVAPTEAASNGGANQSPASSNPGVPVVLPNGEKVEINSATQYLMSPTADLSSVAAAGKQVGAMYRDLAESELSSGGAPLYLVAMLGYYLRQGGVFDYQRSGSYFLSQFTYVWNVNVGLFCEEAGLTLDETLYIAGMYARLKSSNFNPSNKYYLSDDQIRYISLGYNLGWNGIFDEK
jgi:hypothetical protein